MPESSPRPHAPRRARAGASLAAGAALVALLSLAGSLSPAGTGQAAAQEADVSGTWRVTYDQATTNRNGSVEVVRRGTAELTLVQEADSISGRLRGGIFCDGEPCPVTGTVEGRAVHFSTGSWRVQGHATTTDWQGILQEDGSLRGDLSLYLDGRLMDPRSWEAERMGGAGGPGRGTAVDP